MWRMRYKVLTLACQEETKEGKEDRGWEFLRTDERYLFTDLRHSVDPKQNKIKPMPQQLIMKLQKTKTERKS